MNSTSPKPSRRGRNILLLGHAVLILLFCLPAIWIGSQSWEPVTAKVNSTRIERTRPGTPAWSLLVDFDYEVNGKPYSKKNIDVFHDSDRNLTKAEQAKWPFDKTVTGYISEENPESFTLQEDGNLEVAIVITVLLIVVSSLVAIPFYIALSRGAQS